MSLKIRWLGTACFEILLPNERTLIIDPYVDDSVSAPITSDQFLDCHYIFITHGHYDHVLDVSKLAERFRPKIFCNDTAAHSLIEVQGVEPGLITRVKAGDIIREEGLTVEVLPGIHVNFAKEYRRLTGRDLDKKTTDEPLAVIKEALMVMMGTDSIPDKFEEWMTKYPQGQQLNFVFDPDQGNRIYMAGSYPDPTVIVAARRANAFITLLQVLPGNTVHGMEEQIARLAIASNCKIAVPQHHDPLFPGGKKTDLSELKRIISSQPDILFQEFVPGQWYRIDSIGARPISI